MMDDTDKETIPKVRKAIHGTATEKRMAGRHKDGKLGSDDNDPVDHTERLVVKIERLIERRSKMD